MLKRILDLKDTFEGKFLAVLMSVVLVLSMTNVFAFAENEELTGQKAATEELAADEPAPAEADQPAAEPTDSLAGAPQAPLVTSTVNEAVVTFDAPYASVSVKGQAISGTALTTQLRKQLTFAANAIDGYEITSVTAKSASSADVPVVAQDGTYVIAADNVDSTLVVTVAAEPAATEAPSDEPVVETTPITSDTKIEAEGDLAVEGKPKAEVEEPVVNEDVVEVEADVSNPAFEGYATAGNVLVKVTAAEGVLPEGTTVQATQVEREDVVEAVAEKVESQGRSLQDAAAIDVTLLDAAGNEIQPEGAVNVCFFDSNVEGDEVGVYRVSDDASTVETIGTRQADPAVQSFDVDHFTIYVVGTTVSAEKWYSSYEVAVGETVDLYSSARYGKGSWQISEGSDYAEFTHSGNYAQMPTASLLVYKNAPVGKTITVEYYDADYPWLNRQTFMVKVVQGKSEAQTITFEANGGAGNLPEGIAATTGSQVVLPSANLTHPRGYSFIGWSRDAYALSGAHYTSQVYAPGSVYSMPDSSIKLYAIWAKEGLSADFYIRLDGTIPDEPSSHNPSGYTGNIHIANAIKTGQFIADPTGAKVLANLSTIPTNEQIKTVLPSFDPETQYVVWYAMKYESGHADDAWNVDGVVLEKSKLNLTYHMNAPAGEVFGTFPVGKQYRSNDEVKVESSQGFERAGYTFKEWNTESDGTGISYGSGASFKITDNTELYAIWIPNDGVQYKVEDYLQLEDDTWPDEPTYSYSFVGTTGATVNAGSKSYFGYSFDENNANNVLSGKVVGDGSLVLKRYYKTSETYTVLYYDVHSRGEHWEKLDETFLISEVADARTKQEVESAGYNTTLNGGGSKNVLVGWTTDEQAGSKTLNGADAFNDLVKEGAFYAFGSVLPQGVEKLYAVWMKNSVIPEVAHSITYLPGTSEPVSNMPASVENVMPGSPESVSTLIPQRSGYKFAGWDAEGIDVASGSFMMPNNDVTFTAMWILDPNALGTATYAADPVASGSVSSSSDTFQIVTAEGLAGSEAEAALGYKFDGWYKGDQLVTNEAVLSADAAKRALNKADDGTYADTAFVAKFVRDDSQTHSVKAQAEYYFGDTLEDAMAKQAPDAVDAVQTASGWVGEAASVTLSPNTADKFAGYAYRATEGGLTYSVAAGEPSDGTVHVAKVYYVKDDSQTKRTSYTVKHVVDGVERTDDTRVYDGTAWINEQSPTIVVAGDTIQPKAYEGYRYVSTTPAVVDGQAVPDGTTVVLAYEADFSSLSATGFEVTYDGKIHNVQLNGTILPTDTVEYWVGDEQLAANEFVNVADSAEVTVKVVRGSATWTSDPVQAKINPADATIVVNGATKPFGTADPAFTGTISGLVTEGDLGDVTYARLAADEGKENVGDDIALTASYTENGNYNVIVTDGKLVITPSDLNNVVATGIAKTYDGQPASVAANAAQPGSTIEYSLDGETWATENPTFADVGTYTVQVRATNPNFSTVTASADVVVNPAILTVTADNQTKVAGAADPQLTFTFAGAVNGEVPGFVGALERAAGEDVGTYAINQGALALADNDAFKVSNYELRYVAGTLAITAAPVTPPTPPAPTTPPTTPTTPTTTPAGPVEAIAEALQAPVEAIIGEPETPLADIGDNETPLANHPWCWVHWYIILGILITALYAACVATRRGLFSRKLKQYEDDLTGGGDPAPGAPSGSGRGETPPVGIPKGAPATAASGLGE